MPSYLVEMYVPGSGHEDVRAAGRHVQAAADALARRGMPIRYVRTTILPDDETCFHLVEAPSSTAVEELCRQAGFGEVRVTTALEA